VIRWIEEYGREAVARAFFCIEYFPYASRYYKRMRRPLASQDYSFELARAKVRSRSLVVAMRHAKQWAAVLGVSGDDWIRRRNPRLGSLNPPGPARRSNLDPGDANRIRRAIEAHALGVLRERAAGAGRAPMAGLGCGERCRVGEPAAPLSLGLVVLAGHQPTSRAGAPVNQRVRCERVPPGRPELLTKFDAHGHDHAVTPKL
jgi:hypothetical protein